MDITEDKTNLLADEALEDFSTIQNKLPYSIATTIGTALGKLQNLEKAEHEGRLVALAPLDEDNYNGLKVKYRVFKARNGEPVENCFVLRPDKDIAARHALRKYAQVCDNSDLQRDINVWLIGIEEAEKALEGEDDNENGRI